MDFGSRTALIDDAVLTSLDIAASVSELNEELDVDISLGESTPRQPLGAGSGA